MRYDSILENGITIGAASEGKYVPDLFTIEVDFGTDKDSREECIEAYNEDYALVKEALVKVGVTEDAIATGPFSVTIHYEWVYEKIEENYSGRHREEYRRVRKEVDGYEYEGSLLVELPMDLKLVKTIWSALNDIDGYFSFSFNYRLEHPEIHERELLEQAVAEARKRAEVLAAAANIKLGSVEAINHEYRYASSIGNRTECYKSETVFRLGSEDVFRSPDGTPDLNPEDIPVSCSVTLRWAVEQ